MPDKNYSNLRRALDRLPDHAPPPAVWSSVERGLEPPLAERLPGYRPPTSVWNSINQQLDGQQHPTATRVRTLWSRYAGVAAAAVLALTMGVGWLLGYDPGPSVTYAYSTEAAPAPIIDDWTLEEDNFNRVVAEIEARNEPRLNTLGHELTELTAASQEVQAMLVAYGDDPGIVRQLADIERDRSDIYRRIIVEL